MANCPCGSNEPYTDCCGPYLAGEAIAPTAEALMRSRYTAYVRGNVDYLLDTHHPNQRSAKERVQLRQTINSTTWLGLTVVDTRQGGAKDHKGVVEFVALYRPKVSSASMTSVLTSSPPANALSTPQVSQLHERSRFVREVVDQKDSVRNASQGETKRWLYVDGDQLPPLAPKRNAPCWCRSGKKFKHCHGK